MFFSSQILGIFRGLAIHHVMSNEARFQKLSAQPTWNPASAPVCQSKQGRVYSWVYDLSLCSVPAALRRILARTIHTCYNSWLENYFWTPCRSGVPVLSWAQNLKDPRIIRLFYGMANLFLEMSKTSKNINRKESPFCWHVQSYSDECPFAYPSSTPVLSCPFEWPISLDPSVLAWRVPLLPCPLSASDIWHLHKVRLNKLRLVFMQTHTHTLSLTHTHQHTQCS